MDSQHRRSRIAELVGVRGFARVVDLADELAVSEVTIRGDLSSLERDGMLLRVHGGARAITGRERPLEQSADRNAAAKLAIGRAAADLVRDGDCVYLDVGSTALAVALALVERADLRDVVVVTSGLTIALALEPAVPRFTVVVSGGTLRPLQHSLVAPFAAPLLGTGEHSALNVDLALIGCNGVDRFAGVTNVNLPEAEVKRAVLERAQRAVLLADASKLGRIGAGSIAPLERFELLITSGERTAVGEFGIPVSWV